MQGIIGVTLCVLAFWGLYRFLCDDPYSPEHIKDWPQTDGVVVKKLWRNSGADYYVEFLDEKGKNHVGESIRCARNAFLIGDQIKVRYRLYKTVQGTGVDARVVIEESKKQIVEEEKKSFRLNSVTVFLLCAVGFGILDVYLIIQEIIKLVAN